MRISFLRLITIVLGLCLLAPGLIFGQYQMLGGPLANNPSCASPADNSGQVTCAFRLNDGSLYGIRIDPRTGYNSGPQSLGGRIVNDASCAGPANVNATTSYLGQVICAVKGTDSALYGIAFNPGTGYTTGYQYLGGTIEDTPSCAAPNDLTGDVICGVKGPDSSLYGIRFNPVTGSKTGYQYLGGIVQDSPSCATSGSFQSSGTASIICGVKAINSGLYGIQFDPGTGFATGYQALGGTLQDRASCATGIGNEVICAVKGTDSALYGIEFGPQAGTTTGYLYLGGTIEDNFSCANQGGATGATCAVKSIDGSLYGIRFYPSTKFTTGYVRYGGSLQGNPSCAYASTGTVICGVKQADSALYGIAVKP